MLADPRPGDLGLDPFLYLGVGNTENENRVPLIDSDKTELAASFANNPRRFLRSVDSGFGNRLLEAQVVDGDADQSILSLQGGIELPLPAPRAEDERLDPGVLAGVPRTSINCRPNKNGKVQVFERSRR